MNFANSGPVIIVQASGALERPQRHHYFGWRARPNEPEPQLQLPAVW